MKSIPKQMSFYYWIAFLFFLTHFFILVGVYCFFWQVGQRYFIFAEQEAALPSFIIWLYWLLNVFLAFCALFLGYKTFRFFRMFLLGKEK